MMNPDRRTSWWPFRLGLAWALILVFAVRAGAQNQEFMAEPQFRHHAAALGVAAREDTPLSIVIDWYLEESAAFQTARSSIQTFLGAGPTEMVSGPVPPSFESQDDTPFFVFRNRAIERMRTTTNRLINHTNAKYFDRLRTAYVGREDVVDRLERAWRRERQFAALDSYFGANVDLIRVADEALSGQSVRQGVRGSLDTILSEWEGAVDGLLAKHEKNQTTWRERYSDVLAGVREGTVSVDDAAEVAEERTLAEVRVLNATESCMARMRSQLDGDDLAALNAVWHEYKYPFIWQRRDERAPLAAILRRDDLSDDHRSAAIALRDELEQKCRAAAARLDRLQRRMLNENELRDYYRRWLAWYVDRSLPYATNPADDAFTEAGREFLESMNQLGERITDLTAQLEGRR